MVLCDVSGGRWRAVAVVLVICQREAASASNNATIAQVFCTDCEAKSEDDFLNVPTWSLPIVVAILLTLALVAACMGSPWVHAWRRRCRQECLRHWLSWWARRRRRRSVSPVEDGSESGSQKEESLKGDLVEQPPDVAEEAFSCVVPCDSAPINVSIDNTAQLVEARALEDQVGEKQSSCGQAVIGIVGARESLRDSDHVLPEDDNIQEAKAIALASLALAQDGPTAPETQQHVEVDDPETEVATTARNGVEGGQKESSRGRKRGSRQERRATREHSPEARQPLVDGGNVVLWQGARRPH